MTKCKKCGYEAFNFSSKIKELCCKYKKYEVYYYKCPNCGTVFTKNIVSVIGLSNLLQVSIPTIYKYVSKDMPHKYEAYTFEGHDDRLIFNINRVYEWLKINNPKRSEVLKMYIDNAN